MHNVLVTGANGFIGSALCRRLLAEGWGVRGTIRSFAKKHLLAQEINAVEIGSIDANTEWETAVCGIDTIVHLAARVHVMDDITSDPITAFRNINVAGTIHLAQIAADKKVRRFIYISSVKVNGEGKKVAYTEQDEPSPSDPYGSSKWEAEQLLQKIAAESNMGVVILRPPLVYGPGVKTNFLRLLTIVERGFPLPFASVKNHRSLIYIENLIDAIVTCIIHPKAAGKTYLLSDGEDVSTPELIRRIAEALGKSPRLFSFPPSILSIAANLTREAEAVNRLLNSLSVDITKIGNDLDWKPRNTMREGLSETASWFLKESKKEQKKFWPA